MSRLPARLIVRFAARLLPPAQRDWGRAMEAELAAIDRALPAFLFALGCLGYALRQATNDLAARPRHLAALCATASTGLGLTYLAAAGAPSSYLAINAAALAIGFLAIGILAMAPRFGDAAKGLAAIALAAALVLTSFLGVSADGVTRWISAGGLPLQPSLLVLPLLALSFARSRGTLSTLAILIAATALALQPDRAMSGALAAGMAALALLRPERNTLLAAAASLTSFAATMIRPDPSPAMPFVDQIFYSSFDVHPLAGLAVLAGAVLMLVPALVGYRRDVGSRQIYAVFGMIWLAVIAAAALGNYPTPLVGYSGSAIVGYLLSLIGLPRHTGAAAIVEVDTATDRGAGDGQSKLRAGLSFSS